MGRAGRLIERMSVLFAWRPGAAKEARPEQPTDFLQALLQLLALLARSEGFEPPTPRFEVWLSRTQPDLTERTCPQNRPVYKGFVFRCVRLGSVAVSDFASPVCPQT